MILNDSIDDSNNSIYANNKSRKLCGSNKDEKQSHRRKNTKIEKESNCNRHLKTQIKKNSNKKWKASDSSEENNILQKFKEKHLERKERAKENKNVADHF